ncbi:Ankyrin repeat protein [Arthroderma uncinatum]|uniref:Ankyrin repeat protein n=1 Tax=Arthroderma uncinatum TaxID=74035 RepID=UPI00144AB14F|nr:Ankyrin repeat protein [Arthroderma uncinatum]KAF3491416.1 Ankyrin repeat protein [Arthroderma uncinatum]
MALTLSPALVSDAERIADIHMSAFQTNGMLLAQFPTPTVRKGLWKSLVEKVVTEINDPKWAVLVVRNDRNHVISFAKWCLPILESEKYEETPWRWPEVLIALVKDIPVHVNTRQALVLWQQTLYTNAVVQQVYSLGGDLTAALRRMYQPLSRTLRQLIKSPVSHTCAAVESGWGKDGNKSLSKRFVIGRLFQARIVCLLASIANLVTASGQIIELIGTFKDGEKELADLAKDISIFQEILKGFVRGLRSTQTRNAISKDFLQKAVEDASEAIKELEARIILLSKPESSTSDCLHILMSQANYEALFAMVNQNSQLREVCANVAAELENESLHGDDADGFPDNSFNSLFMNTSAKMTQDTNLLPYGKFGSRPESLSLSHTSSRSSISSSIFSSGTNSTSSSAPDPDEYKPTTALITTQCKPSTAIPSNSFTIRKACRYNCYCKCHTRSIAVSKEKVECTEPDCAVAIFSPKRVDPPRFFKKVITRLVSSQSVRPQYNLSNYRMVPEGSDAMRYVKHGNLEKLKLAIQLGEATLWDTAPDGWSLLHTAAYARELPIVKYLCELGANTEAGDLGARKPADLAILKSLGVDAGRVEEEIVQVFSKKDDYISDFEFTPIHIAVLDLYDPTDRERPSLEELIEFVDNANNAPPGTDWSSWKAKYKKRSPLFLSVIEQFRVSSLENASTHKIIHNLLDQKDRKFQWTPLHWASSTGRSDKMKILIAKGADPFMQSNLNANILHAAVESNALESLSYALEICKLYPDQLDINQANVWGESPLIMAAQGCLVDCVKLLINAGADRNVRQENEQVALHYAGLASMSKTRRETVSLLCAGENEYSPHINAQDEDGRTPLFDLLDDRECVKILVEHGARLDVLDNSGKSIFHHACIQNMDQTLKLLLRLIPAESSVNPTQKDAVGDTALLTALRHGNIRCAMTLLELDVVGDIVGQNGWTAVHHATKLGNADLLEAVLKHPSFVKGMKTDDGKTAQDIAMEAGTWCGRVKDLLRKYNSTVTSLLSTETTQNTASAPIPCIKP